MSAFVVNFVKSLEETIKRVVREILFQVKISAEFLNGVAQFHILVVIRLVILAKRFEHFDALLVAVRAYEPCKQSDVLPFVEVTHKPHKDGFVALVFRKNFHQHFARFTFECIDFVNHIVENGFAVLEQILVGFESLMVGQILVEQNFEVFEHLFFRFYVGRDGINLLHLHLRK